MPLYNIYKKNVKVILKRTIRKIMRYSDIKAKTTLNYFQELQKLHQK